jgi:hypothetical protein
MKKNVETRMTRVIKNGKLYEMIVKELAGIRYVEYVPVTMLV